ncbi:amino acid ABC transporter ATP-binding protein, PAAT family (TC 3.A.1.3.-) [Pseudobutyrivibrio sp. NOR37]|uniref:Amino acid ABC transporter ATP-binding protein n=1 Tax=Pseudobutyrivibrio xylanivorans TaxID=185007 RepID=A0A6M0LJ92_PSEXY|nr:MULTISPECIES: amino acid ABC transporter ATP-binding protein [Pseudobutyrivibrio]NEX02575.1 amino acid ABC transporter ATP-binding protein [Pseudobutyrivibrio xylanivorans]SFR82338.1 amino acid ABC transporter ATP-binding protein, PAAT family (TC 3.A.1.3.-) [Pseudobutyrivibrio sp. NOR37]
MIKIQNLQKSFGDKVILKNIDLDVAEGETVAIIGPSGSGKSTTLRCINLLERPDQGELTIGKNTYDFNKLTKHQITEIRRTTAMVFQNFSLYENKTALQNITLPLIKAKGYGKHEAEKTALEYLDKVGLKDWKDHYPAQLSGGQQQRVGIARALALKPEVILFDEPTSALDPERVQGVLEIIKEISKERITSVIVTHELEFALDVADKVVFIADGEVVEKGTAKEVLKSPKDERTIKFLGHFADKLEYVI